MSDRPRVLSGIQPTADSFHLGWIMGCITAFGEPNLGIWHTNVHDITSVLRAPSGNRMRLALCA